MRRASINTQSDCIQKRMKRTPSGRITSINRAAELFDIPGQGALSVALSARHMEVVLEPLLRVGAIHDRE